MTIYNFQLLNVPFANTAIASEIAPFPDYNRGLGIAFSQTDGKPEMKGLNGLFNIITASMLYLKQRGISEWDATLEYPANAFVTDGEKLYKSKLINTNKQPSLSQLDWDVWASISDISVSTNGNLKKTIASDGSVTLEVPTATDSQRGAVRQATSTEVANKSNVNAYINPANVGQTFGASLSANGWCRLPNGLILQWGRVQVTDNQTLDVNLPTPFMTAFLSCTVSLENITIGSNNLATIAAAPLSLSKIRLKTEFSYNLVTNANYFAIGY